MHPSYLSKKSKLIIALSLMLPAPSLGVMFGMILFSGTITGKLVFILSKIWFFLFPLMYLLFIDRKKLSLSPSRKGGVITGIIVGLIISSLIILLYTIFKERFIDTEVMSLRMRDIGLSSLSVYIFMALYWILVNSVLEEYAWRWFIVEKISILAGDKLAIFLSAVFFTIHHGIALSIYFKLPLVICLCFGIFIGGAIWSWMYTKYKSIWPAYVSHAIVDLAIFAIGIHIVFL